MTNEFAALSINPFEDDAVTAPRAVTYSVPGLNDNPLNHVLREFDKLTLGELPRKPIPASRARLVVSPDAGYGKSHLLGRLFQKLGERATKIYLRPFQNPQRAWHSILLTTIQELGLPNQNGKSEGTQLDALAMGVLAHVAADLMAHGGVIDYNKVKKEVDYLRKHPLEVLSRSRSNTVLIDWLKDRLAKQNDLIKLAHLLNRHDINLDGREKIWLRVLAGYAFFPVDSVERDAALAWLRAEPLDDEQARALRVTPGSEGADADVWQINNLSLTRLRDLCSLSSYYRPFLFCFDQTEFYGSDKILVEALGNCIEELYATIPNHLTVVTANATNWTQDIRPNLKPANQARFSTAIDLEGINEVQGRELLAERLKDFQLKASSISQFLEATWLSSQFSPQPNIGVRHLLVRAAERLRTLAKAPPRLSPPMAEVFAIEINKVRAKPALHQYNQDCLMWFTQVLIDGFDGVKVKKPKNRYFSTQWEWKDRSVYFAFEGGDNNSRWRAMAKEAVDLAAGGRTCAVVFRTPDLKPVPGPRWQAARQIIDQACQKGLRIERLNVDEICELHAAREFYSNSLQGNVEFTSTDVLAWLKTRFRPWFEKYSSVNAHDHEPPPAAPGLGRVSRSKSPTNNAPRADAHVTPPARLSESQLKRVLDHMKKRLLADINEVLEALGSAALREALLVEVERHPNLKAHPGPQTIYLQWRIA
jgi:hypothetical protein